MSEDTFKKKLNLNCLKKKSPVLYLLLFITNFYWIKMNVIAMTIL